VVLDLCDDLGRIAMPLVLVLLLISIVVLLVSSGAKAPF